MMGEIDVEPGIHNVKIEYYGTGNTLLFVDDKGDKEYKKNELNLEESFYLY